MTRTDDVVRTYVHSRELYLSVTVVAGCVLAWCLSYSEKLEYQPLLLPPSAPLSRPRCCYLRRGTGKTRSDLSTAWTADYNPTTPSRGSIASKNQRTRALRSTFSAREYQSLSRIRPCPGKIRSCANNFTRSFSRRNFRGTLCILHPAPKISLNGFRYHLTLPLRTNFPTSMRHARFDKTTRQKCRLSHQESQFVDGMDIVGTGGSPQRLKPSAYAIFHFISFWDARSDARAFTADAQFFKR